jgi:hypothetical protein
MSPLLSIKKVFFRLCVIFILQQKKMIVIDPILDKCRGLWFPEGTTVVYVSRPWSEEFYEHVIEPFARIGVTFELLEQDTENCSAHKICAVNVTTMASLNAAKDATENMDDLPELLPIACPSAIRTGISVFMSSDRFE